MSQIDRRAAGEAARAFDLPEANVLAVAHVESGGQVFATVDGRPEPLIRFEGHIFFRLLSGEAQTTAVAEGLAHSKAGKVKNPKSQAARWRLLARAAAIDPVAAREATSWGVGQVMGMHWQRLGYPSVQAMEDRAREGLVGQLDLMLRYVRAFGLDDELREGQWAPFARGYNGPAYAKNRYDVRLQEAAEMFGGSTSLANGMLRMGSKGARVSEVQALLVRAGHAVKVDGDFGPTTRDHLRQFQKARGLTADGIYGPETETALSAYRQEAGDKPGKTAILDIPAVRAGGLATVVASVTPQTIEATKAGLEAAVSQIAGAGVESVALDYLTSGLSVAAGLLGVAGLVVAGLGILRAQHTVVA